METTNPPTKVHVGRKISRLREFMQMKQDYLASELGVSQQAISNIEQSEEVEDSTLEKIAGVLGVSKEAILKFSDEAVVNYFNNFNDNSFSNSNGTGLQNTNNCNNCTFHPLDKLMEVVEENKKLYERLLKSEQEKISILMERQTK